MSVLSLSKLRRRTRPRASQPACLPHWSEVGTDPPRGRPAASVGLVLRDLVAWAADIAIVLTHGCPEDREAIERVRRHAYAWLAGESCPDVEIDDVLTTAAALMAGIDRDIGGRNPDPDECDAIGARVVA
jgi:hypothetical protein